MTLQDVSTIVCDEAGLVAHALGLGTRMFRTAICWHFPVVVAPLSQRSAIELPCEVDRGHCATSLRSRASTHAFGDVVSPNRLEANFFPERSHGREKFENQQEISGV